MKPLGMIVLLLLLATLLPPHGHGARTQVGRYQRPQQSVPVQIIRSPKAAQELKIVRVVGPSSENK